LPELEQFLPLIRGREWVFTALRPHFRLDFLQDRPRPANRVGRHRSRRHQLARIDGARRHLGQRRQAAYELRLTARLWILGGVIGHPSRLLGRFPLPRRPILGLFARPRSRIASRSIYCLAWSALPLMVRFLMWAR